ncbi:GyrI-like domain-containing protein [Evansella sp. AB-P1]|uniref:GyrI-like domain-containing protein n=1 Tax=Evansella sp. AB-P1 TaxID=3037653 RepID=UPI00241BFD07|nr:GyrI-like domain-containing protein [Evansella sp. AB-P1]MDG5788018.1 GyrI-like domain-containing protein [Evansella sp. AB-P1]
MNYVQLIQETLDYIDEKIITPPVGDDDFVASIQGTWKYILEEWFPSSGYEIDDTKLDFEFYDERCHPWEFDKFSMEIHVPIKKSIL